MATWFDGVTAFLEFAPDDTPLTALADVTWVDITAYMRSTPGVHISRGRSTELSPFSPGMMTVALDNRTRVFDSSNTAGSYYQKLLPMKRIRYRVVYGGTEAVLFTGYVLGWPITYPDITDSIVTIQCVDAFRIMQQSKLPGSAYAAEVLADSPTHYWPMQDDYIDVLTDATGARDVPVRTSGGVPTRTTATTPIGGGDAWYTPTMEANDTYSGWSTPLAETTTVPAAIELWYLGGANALVRSSVASIVSTTDGFAVGAGHGVGTTITVAYSHGGNRDSVGSGVGVQFAIPNFAVGSIYHILVSVSGTTITVYIDGEAVGTDTLVAGSWTLAGGRTSVYLGMADAGAISHVAHYATQPSTDRIEAHYLAGLLAFGAGYGERTGDRIDRVLDAISWPAADRDISDGETFCGEWLPAASSALQAARELEDSEQGLFFISGDGKVVFRDRQWQMTATNAVTPVVTFGDTSDVPYTAVSVDGNQIEHVRNSVTVTYRGGVVSVDDATSKTAYGEQTDSVNAVALPSSASWLARQLANFRLRTRKDPAARVPLIEVKPRIDMATCFDVATLELGDRVVVNRNPSGGTGSISAKCQVQGIDHYMSGDDWTIRLYLAPAPKSYTEAPYLIAGSTSASYVGVASGNLVPY